MMYSKCIRWTLLLLLLVTEWSAAQGLKVYSELRREQVVQPGETYQGSIRLENVDDHPLVVKIFQEDYSYDVTRRRPYNSRHQDGRSNKSWITFKPDYLELLPNTEGVVDFMVSVPHSTRAEPLEGTYWSMLIVQPAPLEETDMPLTLVRGQKVYRQVQYGIQMVTHIANTGEKDILVEDTWIETDTSGTARFHAVLRNTGTIGFRSDVAVELYDEQGRVAGKTENISTYIYPGCAVLKNVLLPDLKPGTYPSLLLIDGGSDALFGMQVNLDINTEQAMR